MKKYLTEKTEEAMKWQAVISAEMLRQEDVCV